MSRKATVIAKCVNCGDRREIEPYEVPRGRQPRCHECAMPMIADIAEREEDREDT